MTNRDDDVDRKLADLDARLQELEAIQSLTLRILSTTKPLDAVLEQYGATHTQQQAFYRLLDEMASRSRAPEHEQPTYAYFLSQLDQIFHQMPDSRGFVDLAIDTMRIERPAYRDLHAYMIDRGWVK